MSLHAKIVAWFVFFASTILTLFVLGDYYQSNSALSFALETRVREIADRFAADIDRRYASAEAELLGLGYAVASRAASAASPPDAPDRFSRISVSNGSRVIWSANPTRDAQQPDGCGVGVVSFHVPFRDAAGRDLIVSAAMPTANFFEATGVPRFGRGGIASVMNSSDGTLVFDQACAIRSAQVPPGLEQVVARLVRAGGEAAPLVRTIELNDEATDHRMLAIARAHEQDWSVVIGLDYAEFAAPFVAMRTKYLAAMVIVLVGALLIVLRAIRNDMHRLNAIAQAAHAIGHGRFDIWLPPPTGDEVGRVSLALGRMVDRLSATMRQMEISRAMVAVGEMATYLSHEIRNPLSSIRLNLQMLRRDLAKNTVPDDAPQLVALCLTELQRLDDVVKTVLEVGRPHGSTQRDEKCDAHDVIDDTLRVLHAKFAADGINVQKQLGAASADVVLGAAQLKSVLLNLLLNSIEALGSVDAKRITIATQVLDAPDGDVVLELRIADTGHGIPAHLRERIFEPFFTTKSHGNGIGLATALRILQDCGGVLRCEPTVWDGGAEFVLEIPVATVSINTTPRRMAIAAV